MIFERTEVLKSFDGGDIFFRCCTPRVAQGEDVKISGLVVAVHGFGEHSGRYGHVAEFVCKKGLAFASFDLRGHGHSGPARGDVENLHSLILDVIYVVNHALRILGFAGNASKRDDFFFGLLGHSYGGLLVTYAASILAESCPPIFLRSPCYKVKRRLPFWKRQAALILPRVVPDVRVPLDIDPDVVSKNPKNNIDYVQDKLNLKEVTARFGRVLIDSMEETNIRNAMGQILAPVTICYAGGDELVSAEKTEELAPFFTAGSLFMDKVEDAGHEIFNEIPEYREHAFASLGNWIASAGVPA